MASTVATDVVLYSPAHLVSPPVYNVVCLNSLMNAAVQGIFVADSLTSNCENPYGPKAQLHLLYWYQPIVMYYSLDDLQDRVFRRAGQGNPAR
eukprot:5623364-Pyramimonas_sp.AAC.1